MPTFMELQKRFKHPDPSAVRFGPEEMLIEDERAEMRPGHFIEQKLRAALRNVPGSRLATRKRRSVATN